MSDWQEKRIEEELIMRAYATGEPVTLASVPAGMEVAFDSTRMLLLGRNAAISLGDGWTWREEAEADRRLVESGPWPAPPPMVDLNRIRARRARYGPDNAPALGGEK